MQKSHPKVVNPRDIAGERKKKKKKKKKTCHSDSPHNLVDHHLQLWKKQLLQASMNRLHLRASVY